MGTGVVCGYGEEGEGAESGVRAVDGEIGGLEEEEEEPEKSS